MAFPTGWSSKKLYVPQAKVSGSANHSNFPILLKDGAIPADVYAGLVSPEINANFLKNLSSLKAYYRFVNGALTTDSSGNSNTLTNNNTAVFSSTKFGNGADLEASSSQYFSIADGSQTGLDISGNLSICAWITPESISANMEIVSKTLGTGSQYSYSFYVNASGGLQCHFSDDGTTNDTHYLSFITDNILSAGTQYHVALTWDIASETAKFYVNGYQVSSSLTFGSTIGATLKNSTADFCVGARSGGSSLFDGKIADVGVFSQVLSSAEIKAAYFGGADLRFTTDSAGATEIAFEVVSLTPESSLCEIWVKLPTLYYNQNTDFYVWYGKNDATPYEAADTYGSRNVWNSAYKGVWHGNTLYDSTSSANTFTKTGTVNNVDASIGKGFSATFSDSTNKLTEASVYAPTTGDVTIQCIFKKNGAPSNDFTPTILSLGQAGGGNRFTLEATKTNGYAASSFVNAGSNVATSSVNICDNSFHYLVSRRIGTAVALFVDGSSVATTTSSKNISDDDINVGYAGLSSTYDYIGTAIIDEIRILNSGLSTDWIATEQTMFNDPATFISSIVTTSVTKSLGYSIKTSHSITKSAQYTVKKPYSLTKSIEYRIYRTIAAITKSLEYVIAPDNVILKSLQYYILLRTGITKSLAYKILLDYSITKQLAYTVLTDATLTKSLSYKIYFLGQITKSLQYIIASSGLIQKSMQYEIGREGYIYLYPAGDEDYEYNNLYEVT